MIFILSILQYMRLHSFTISRYTIHEKHVVRVFKQNHAMKLSSSAGLSCRQRAICSMAELRTGG